jgi:hypothetical protein
LAFVLAVASAGLALVLVVVFAPWYPDAGLDVPQVRTPLITLMTGSETGAAEAR